MVEKDALSSFSVEFIGDHLARYLSRVVDKGPKFNLTPFNHQRIHSPNDELIRRCLVVQRIHRQDIRPALLQGDRSFITGHAEQFGPAVRGHQGELRCLGRRLMVEKDALPGFSVEFIGDHLARHLGRAADKGPKLNRAPFNHQWIHSPNDELIRRCLVVQRIHRQDIRPALLQGDRSFITGHAEQFGPAVRGHQGELRCLGRRLMVEKDALPGFSVEFIGSRASRGGDFVGDSYDDSLLTGGRRRRASLDRDGRQRGRLRAGPKIESNPGPAQHQAKQDHQNRPDHQPGV